MRRYFTIVDCYLELEILIEMSPVMRKPVFCICENKDADQLRGNREADQRLCFRYTDSTIPLQPESEISNLKSFSVAVQPGLCRTLSETSKTGFLTTRLKYECCTEYCNFAVFLASRLLQKRFSDAGSS